MAIDELPRIGLGTFSSDDPDQWTERVQTALNVGYEHLDTAEAYGNETTIGEGIATAGVSRDDIFLATKTVHFRETTSVDEVEEAILGCLNRLGVNYVDLLYVHWPTGIYEHESVLPLFDAARQRGTTRHIGVCNFTPELLDDAIQTLETPITAHQVEMHPYLQQPDLVAHAQEHDYWLVAYSPLAKGRVLKDPVLHDIAQKHDCSVAQVSLAWLLSKNNVAVIPKASNSVHMQENLAAEDIDLDVSDHRRINQIDKEIRLVDPDDAPWNA